MSERSSSFASTSTSSSAVTLPRSNRRRHDGEEEREECLQPPSVRRHSSVSLESASDNNTIGSIIKEEDDDDDENIPVSHTSDAPLRRHRSLPGTTTILKRTEDKDDPAPPPPPRTKTKNQLHHLEKLLKERQEIESELQELQQEEQKLKQKQQLEEQRIRQRQKRRHRRRPRNNASTLKASERQECTPPDRDNENNKENQNNCDDTGEGGRFEVVPLHQEHRLNLSAESFVSTGLASILEECEEDITPYSSQRSLCIDDDISNPKQQNLFSSEHTKSTVDCLRSSSGAWDTSYSDDFANHDNSFSSTVTDDPPANDDDDDDDNDNDRLLLPPEDFVEEGELSSMESSRRRYSKHVTLLVKQKRNHNTKRRLERCWNINLGHIVILLLVLGVISGLIVIIINTNSSKSKMMNKVDPPPTAAPTTGATNTIPVIAGTWEKTLDFIHDQEHYSHRALSNDGNVLATLGTTTTKTGVYETTLQLLQKVSGGWNQIGSDIGIKGKHQYSLNLNANGTVVAVGSREYNALPPYTIQIYQYKGLDWTFFGRIVIDHNGFTDNSSNSRPKVILSANGNTVAVGISINNGNIVMIYRRSNNNDEWHQIGQTLEREEITPNLDTTFGCVISLSSDGTIVSISTISQSLAVEEDINGATTVSDSTRQEGNIQQIEHHDAETSNHQPSSKQPTVRKSDYVSVFQLITNRTEESNGDVDKYYWRPYGKQLQGAGNFGQSTALSHNGTTLVIGAPGAGSSQEGCVYIFQYHKVFESWVHVGPILSGRKANDHLGYSVHFSNDGQRVIAGSSPRQPTTNSNNSDNNPEEVYYYYYATGNEEQETVSCVYAQVYSLYENNMFNWVQVGGDAPKLCSKSSSVSLTSISIDNSADVTMWHGQHVGRFEFQQQL